jgi:hypothetical protein
VRRWGGGLGFRPSTVIFFAAQDGKMNVLFKSNAAKRRAFLGFVLTT